MCGVEAGALPWSWAFPQPRHAAAGLPSAASGEGSLAGRRESAPAHGRDVRESGPVAHRPRHGCAAQDRAITASVRRHRRSKLGKAHECPGRRSHSRHARTRRPTLSVRLLGSGNSFVIYCKYVRHIRYRVSRAGHPGLAGEEFGDRSRQGLWRDSILIIATSRGSPRTG